jgi:hypothetical protein
MALRQVSLVRSHHLSLEARTAVTGELLHPLCRLCTSFIDHEPREVKPRLRDTRPRPVRVVRARQWGFDHMGQLLFVIIFDGEGVPPLTAALAADDSWGNSGVFSASLRYPDSKNAERLPVVRP